MANFINQQLQRTQMIPRAPNSCPEYGAGVGSYTMLSDSEMGSIEIGRTLQLYASRPVASPLTPEPASFFNSNTYLTEMCSTTLTTKSERLWLISVNAIEVIQISDLDSIPRLTSSQILNANYPRYSTLQAQVNWMDGSANSHIVKFDICGGCNFKVFGRNVQVFILSPDNTQIITSNETTQINLSGITLNEMVSASIKPLTVGVQNLDILKYTINQGVVANTAEFIEIPPAARKVKIYNATVGSVTTEMYFWMTNSITGGHCMGIIDFVSNASGLVEIPTGATHINTGIDRATDRCFSFVFTLDP